MERLRVCTCLKEEERENERWHQLDGGQGTHREVVVSNVTDRITVKWVCITKFPFCRLQPQAAILQRKEGTFDAATNSPQIRPNQPLRRFNPKAFSQATTVATVATFQPIFNKFEGSKILDAEKGLGKLGEKRRSTAGVSDSAHKFCTIRYIERKSHFYLILFILLHHNFAGAWLWRWWCWLLCFWAEPWLLFPQLLVFLLKRGHLAFKRIAADFPGRRRKRESYWHS